MHDSVRQLVEYRRALVRIFVCKISLRIEYTIEDSRVLRSKISLRNYVCCGFIDSSFLHVIGDCV